VDERALVGAVFLLIEQLKIMNEHLADIAVRMQAHDPSRS
jgi:hypothetical protein